MLVLHLLPRFPVVKAEAEAPSSEEVQFFTIMIDDSHNELFFF